MKKLENLFKIQSKNEQVVVITLQDEVTELTLLSEGYNPLIKYAQVKFHKFSGYTESVAWEVKHHKLSDTDLIEFEVILYNAKFEVLESESVSKISNPANDLSEDVSRILEFLETEINENITFANYDSMKEYNLHNITKQEVKIFCCH